MFMRQDTAEIKEQARRLGADFVGVADAAGFLNPGYTGNRPQEFMPGIRSVIVVGVVIPKGCVQPLPKGRPEYTNTLMAGTATLRVIAFRIARDLEKQGYLAALVPTEGSEFGMWYADRETLRADISLKYAAWLAGLGTYGLNQLLITSETGPRIRMTAILTDAPLDTDHPKEESFVRPECAACQKCVKVCPVGAISADGTFRPQACRDFMFTTLGGLRCGMCIRVCPL
jgi:epoxyqueuosine reductase QueG